MHKIILPAMSVDPFCVCLPRLNRAREASCLGVGVGCLFLNGFIIHPTPNLALYYCCLARGSGGTNICALSRGQIAAAVNLSATVTCSLRALCFSNAGCELPGAAGLGHVISTPQICHLSVISGEPTCLEERVWGGRVAAGVPLSRDPSTG